MKKTLTAAALSSVLVLGLAASALALDATQTAETATVTKGASKITLDGSVRERGYYDRDNWKDDDSGLGAPGRSAYDSRVQLGVSAKVSDQATGYVKLESGNDSNSDVDTWGLDGAGTGGLFTGGDKNAALTILEAWINYKPGIWGVKAGHMPLALGNKMFFDHTASGDDALVFYADPNAATHVGALTIKFDENTNSAYPTLTNDASNDLDGYVALITHKLNDNVNLGANWTYLRGGGEEEAGFFPGLSLSNIGLTADGKVGAIEYLADLEMQFGTVNDQNTGTAFENIDANGWAVKLGGKYDLGAGKIGLLFAYGTGDGDQENIDDLADGNNDADHDAFINFLSDTTYDTIIAGYRSPMPGTGSWAGASNSGQNNSRNTGLSNLTLFQLNGSTKVVCPLTGKDLSLFASASYMELSEDMINGTDGDGDNNEVDNVGTEVDLIATWALTPGLNYKVEAAYMWTGDVYETVLAGDSDDPKDLAFIRHGLELKF